MALNVLSGRNIGQAVSSECQPSGHLTLTATGADCEAALS